MDAQAQRVVLPNTILSDTFKSFISSGMIIGIFLLIIALITGSKFGFFGSVIGYSFIGIAILLLAVTMMYNNKSNNDGILTILLSLITTSFPFVLLLGIISFILYLLITNKDKIINGYVSPSYYTFTNISILLILLQLFIFFLGTRKPAFIKSGTIDSNLSGIIYIVAVFNIITVISLNIILNYFTTDG